MSRRWEFVIVKQLRIRRKRFRLKPVMTESSRKGLKGTIPSWMDIINGSVMEFCKGNKRNTVRNTTRVSVFKNFLFSILKPTLKLFEYLINFFMTR